MNRRTGPRAHAFSGFLAATLVVPVALGAWATPLAHGDRLGAERPTSWALDWAAAGAPVEGALAPAPAPAAVTASGEQLRSELTRLLGMGAARSGSWGVLAVSLARGDTLFAQNAHAALAPASNQKLLTSAAALHHFGPDFRFPTFLLATGDEHGGVLEGDLILYGTGDPALSDRLLSSADAPLRAFARELQERGIHTVRGDVLGDGTFFQGPTRHHSWNPRDLNDWFAAPVTALTYNENMVTLRIGPARPGEPPRILTQPERAELPFVNRALTVAGGARTSLMVVRDDPDDPIELRGEMTVGRAEVWRRLTVSDPAHFAASILRRVLEEEGIRVEGTAGSVADPSASTLTHRTLVAPAFAGGPAETWPAPRTLAVHYSPPVSRLLEVVNKESHNLYADALLKAMGRLRSGDGSFEGGSRALADYLVGVVGVDPGLLQVEDGSGLSRLNRATPATFIRVLTHMDRDEHADPFWASLPEAGNPRELRRMGGSPAARNLRAKTGTIHRVSALSGVVRSLEGEPILFSIMANDVPSPWAAKQVEDRIGIQLASYLRPLDDLPAPGRAVPLPTGQASPTARAEDRRQDRLRDQPRER